MPKSKSDTALVDDDDDIIIIRRGRLRIARSAVTEEEAEVLDSIAAKGDGPLSPGDAFALRVILLRVAQRP